MKTMPVRSVPPARLRRILSSLALPVLLTAVWLAGVSAAHATSTPPDRMTYQGYLVDQNGVALAPTTPVNYPVIFRLYSESEAGTLVWSEQQIVTVDKGNFSVILGEGTEVSGEPHGALSAAFAGTTASGRYMGITATIGGNSLTLLPRLRLLPAPYSFLASQAAQLVDPSTGVAFVSLTGGGVVNVAGTVNATGGFVGLTSAQVPAALDGARTFSGPVTFSNPVGITGANVLEFGVGNAKEVNNGKIGYQKFSNGLDIVGAGADVANRRITFHAQGGSTFYGKVGIGTANPSTELDINGTSIWRPLTVRGNGGTDAVVAGNLGGRATIGGHVGALNAWADLAINPGGGKVGIGTANPPYLLSLATADQTQTRIRMDWGANYVEIGRYSNFAFIQLNNSLWSAGNRIVTYDGDSNWDFASDRKLKKDIVDVEPMLERTLKVQVRRYRWKEEPSDAKHKLGVIAQEVQPLFPEMVNEVESPDGDHEKHLSVGYGDFGVIAIKAIQELNQIVETKEARITSLEREIDSLKKQVAANAESTSQWEARFAALEKLVAASQPVDKANRAALVGGQNR